METVRTTADADGILTVWLDLPGKPVNTCTPQLLIELNEVISAIERDKPRGVIFASGKQHSFIAGADLFEIRKMNHEQVTHYLADGQRTFNRIAHLPMPTVAAINGDCLGGGLEFALACTYRVAADDGSISIGLPEVKLGIIPGWGGTVRLPRTIGLAIALPLMLAGKTLPPRKAKKAGIVDDVVRPETVVTAARRWILSGAEHHQPERMQRLLASTAFTRKKIFATARKKTEATTFGNYPAPIKLIDVVQAGYDNGEDAGFTAERDGLVSLMETDACRSLLRLFFLRRDAKRWASNAVHATPNDVKHAAVIGGGTMGAGIVHALIRAGIPVRLVEVDPLAASAAQVRVRRLLDDEVKSGKLSALQAKHAMNRVSPTTDWTGLKLADVVIEAVLETMEVKREVFAKLDRLTRPDAVLATNTSSLSVTEMADATLHPNRVVGLHFFNPVPKMPLVEVVRTHHSDDQSLATAAALASKLGKTPIIVNDAPGFLVNRILIPFLAEAIAMAGEGVGVEEIDRATKQWGMPMGAFELLDEIGLDIAHHVLKSLAGSMGQRVPVPATLQKALEHGWLGKKRGLGFYHYESKAKDKNAQVHAEMSELIRGSAAPKTVSPEEIQWRLVLPMINEATRLLAEGVIDSTDAIDLATVFGLGLAPFRGGLIRYADSIGSDLIVQKLDALAQQFGQRFTPSELLRQLAKVHKPIKDFASVMHVEVLH